MELSLMYFVIVCVLFYRIVMGLWDGLFSSSGYLNLLLFKDSESQTMLHIHR